jgi:hypothetical protein
MKYLNFNIDSSLPVSAGFRNCRITNFSDACSYVKSLPYKRNENKSDLLCVFKEACGTCSTKHALLKELASENGQYKVQLIIGIFKMNGNNTPAVKKTLAAWQIDYIPEAHNYLKNGEAIIDCTGNGFDPDNYIPDLLEEKEIDPMQITDFKVAWHQQFLRSWLKENPSVYSFEEIWKIREECILALSR